MRKNPGPSEARELENAIERAVVLARGQTIEVEDLLLDLTLDPAADPTTDGEPDATGDPDQAAANARSLHEFLDAAAASQIRSVLREVAGVRTKAAERLGVDRATLYRLMRKYAISDDS